MILMKRSFLISVLLCSLVSARLTAVGTAPLVYINHFIENGSPLFWETQENGSVLISLMYDHERNSPNRAAGHWHFQLVAPQGSQLKLVLQNFNNIWNGRTSSAIKDNTPCYISTDGKNWSNVPTTKMPVNRLEVNILMPADSLFVARVEPYRISDLGN